MAYALRRGVAGTGRAAVVGISQNLCGVPAEPKKLAAVTYTFVDGMLEKRGPYRADHLALLKTMSEEGTCLLGGAYAEPCDGSFILFSSPEYAKSFVDTDPYNTAGLVTAYQIRDYMAVVGSMLK